MPFNAPVIKPMRKRFLPGACTWPRVGNLLLLKCFSASAIKSAVSLTLRVITPSWPTLIGRMSVPCMLTKRLRVGFKPTNPHAAAGMRIEPPPSLP